MTAWPLAQAAEPGDRLRPDSRGPRAAQLAQTLAIGRPLRLAPDPVGSGSIDDLSRTARTLLTRADAVLVADLPPLSAVLRAATYRRAGLDVWCRLSIHDRNRVAVEGELAALIDLDVAAVVIGLDPVPGRVSDLSPLDCVRLAAYAGHLVAVDFGPDLDLPDSLLNTWRDAGAAVALDGLGVVPLNGRL